MKNFIYSILCVLSLVGCASTYEEVSYIDSSFCNMNGVSSYKTSKSSVSFVCSDGLRGNIPATNLLSSGGDHIDTYYNKVVWAEFLLCPSGMSTFNIYNRPGKEHLNMLCKSGERHTIDTGLVYDTFGDHMITLESVCSPDEFKLVGIKSISRSKYRYTFYCGSSYYRIFNKVDLDDLLDLDPLFCEFSGIRKLDMGSYNSRKASLHCNNGSAYEVAL